MRRDVAILRHTNEEERRKTGLLFGLKIDQLNEFASIGFVSGSGENSGESETGRGGSFLTCFRLCTN